MPPTREYVTHDRYISSLAGLNKPYNAVPREDSLSLREVREAGLDLLQASPSLLETGCID